MHVIDNKWFQTAYIRFGRWVVSSKHQVLKFQTFLLHIESNLDRLGLLSPTHDQRSQQQSGQITLQPVLINKSKFLKATHRTKIRKIEIPRSMVVEAMSW